MNKQNKIEILGLIGFFVLLGLSMNTKYFIPNTIASTIVSILLIFVALFFLNIHKIVFKNVKSDHADTDKVTDNVKKRNLMLLIGALSLGIISAVSIAFAIYL